MVDARRTCSGGEYTHSLKSASDPEVPQLSSGGTSMPLWSEYYLPVSVDEAVGLLARHGGKARVVAGGTDLILDLQQGNEHPVEALVDVTRIVGLNEIREANGYLTIGAVVTHNQIVENVLLQQKG